MHLWRRLADPKWLEANGEALRLAVGQQLVLVQRPGRRSVILEVVCQSRRKARELVQDFGGEIEAIPRDWRKIYARTQALPPLRIGKRLIIWDGEKVRRLGLSHLGNSHLVIPAGAAFGTGGHATTAMTLRLLEQVTRQRKPGWSLTDLGTGSGILALAAHRFGAGRVTAIDNDPIAISTARANARRNLIPEVLFELGDVRRWQPKERVDVVTANLFSELLVETLPGIPRFLARGGEMILSGILRSQEREVRKALRRNRFRVRQTRRRGKWVAIVCSN